MVTGALADHHALRLLRLAVPIGAVPMHQPSRHQGEHSHQQEGRETTKEGWEQVEQAHSEGKVAKMRLREQGEGSPTGLVAATRRFVPPDR